MIDLPIGMTQDSQINGVNPGTLDESYDLAIRALDSYSQEISSAETRLIGVLAIGSIIIGLLPAVLANVNLLEWQFWPNWLLYIALATYLLAVYKAYQGLRGREFFSMASFDPAILREHYWDLDTSAFKAVIYEEIETALELNRVSLDRKNKAVVFAVPAVGLEILFLLAWTFARESVPIF